MSTAVFTALSPNYRHFARVLMASVRLHHPEWDRFVLLVGEVPATSMEEEAFATVRAEELPVPDLRRFFFRYSVLELNTALKPWMFEWLFARGFDRVVYLDPDVFLYSPLQEIETAPNTLLLLTPHLTDSIGGDAHPSDRTILQAGAYNLGFLAVFRHPELTRFLAWWKAKLEFHCVVDTAAGLFADQKWMDLAPGLFSGVVILRHEGYNVAYWNLRQRTVSSTAGQKSVNGVPLRFFHFSGFDPLMPKRLSRHSVAGPGSFPGAEELLEDYAQSLRDAGAAAFANASYAFGVFADGRALPDLARMAYRNSTRLQRESGDDPFQRSDLYRRFRFIAAARQFRTLVPVPVRTLLRDLFLPHDRARLDS